jgi:nitrogen-specific signal transduction histidine kinase
LPGAAPLHIDGSVAPLHAPTNRTTGAIVVFRDVTERNLLQAQLQRTATLESVGVLAGGIAHDFNNILTALLANLSLAEMDATPGSELENYLGEAHAATDRAAALAKQLLTFAKGGDPLLAAVDLGKAIEEVTRFTLRGTRVEAVFELAPDLWPARADAGQLAQIIQNLVLNASQSMPEGGIVKIAASNEEVPAGHRTGLPAGRYVRLIVSDTGTGIAPEAMDKIFTPYFTTKSGGNGLGLAVVYSIVNKHHGTIDVRSSVGRGTTFEILLPADSGVTRETVTPHRRGRPEVHGRVLVMDDEPAILRVVGAYLRTLGLDVVTAADGEQAIREYREGLASGDRFDVVVMDLTVPGKMGGREAIAELRKLDSGVRAIVASGYSSDPVLANFASFGFSAVAAKPFDIVRLGDQVAKLLDLPQPS